MSFSLILPLFNFVVIVIAIPGLGGFDKTIQYAEYLEFDKIINENLHNTKLILDTTEFILMF